MSSITDKVVVITGAAGTLCSVIAKDLAGCGAKVALLGRTEKSINSLRGEILGEGGKAMAIPADVTSIADLECARDKILAEWGVINALVNGAGGKKLEAVTEKREFSREELSGECRGFFNLDSGALREELDLNIIGTILPSQVFGAVIARQGGSIINFASMNSYRPLSRMPGYALAKAGIINFTQWLACYTASAGIRVNAVAPGFFVNDRSRKLLYTEDGGLSERGGQVVSHTPMGRFGEAQEITGAVRWLLDDQAASFVNGVCIPVDGGFLSSSGL